MYESVMSWLTGREATWPAFWKAWTTFVPSAKLSVSRPLVCSSRLWIVTEANPAVGAPPLGVLSWRMSCTLVAASSAPDSSSW